MFKSEKAKAIEERARQLQSKDKRLSWRTALRRAESEVRLFNHNNRD